MMGIFYPMCQSKETAMNENPQITQIAQIFSLRLSVSALNYYQSRNGRYLRTIGR